MSSVKPNRSLVRFIKSYQNAGPLCSAQAFGDLYQRAHLAIFRYIFGMRGGPQEEVEDLTAETFTRGWQARCRFEGDEEAAVGWLLKIARRLVIDDYRRQKVQAVDVDAPSENLPDLGTPPEDLILAGEQRWILHRLLQNLPDETREILVLRYMLGWRVNQVAAYLEIPENTVSVIIRRALKRLRSEWPQS